ncbi:MAG: hypothetical protein E7514_05360 [Ruminococcaceae bacterium]|nr:hypothetical protein [Oscillospiraceae bacterium]
MIYKNANIIFENEIKKADLITEDGIIKEITQNAVGNGAEVYNCEGLYLSAGLIDLHVHGGGGYSFMGNESDILHAAEAHRKNGVTSILPTALADGLDVLGCVCENVKRAKRKNKNILGVHLEGPFLSKEMCGAQNSDKMLISSRTDYMPLLEKYGDIIKMTGAAPELDGGFELGKTLADFGIVASVAHSSGDYDTAVKALSYGYSDITHIYNACTSYRKDSAYRKAGTAEAGLSEDGYTVQVIADLIHLPAGLIRLIHKAKGADRMYLISDGLEFSASEFVDGARVIQKNGVEALIKDGAAFTSDGKRLAGSIASGITLVKNVYNTGISLTDSVKMMTLTPAKVVGADRKGRIRTGCDADIIVFDKEFNLKHISA